MTTSSRATRSSTTALVTGANKGLGQETVRQLAARGWTVWLGARDAELGEKAAADLDGDVRVLPLDVTNDASVAAAVGLVATTGLDVLVNNAGVAGTLAPAVETVPTDFLPTFGVNVLGPVRMIHAFLPLLRVSATPRIVNVSSGLGSLAITTDPDRFESTLRGLVYPASKASLNMITSQYAKELDGFKVNSVDPGYTATDLNGHSGPQSVAEGAEAIVTAATLGPDGPTGAYFDRHGPLPW